MTDRVQVFAIVGSVALLLLVLELVRRRQLAEEYSALWILSSLVLIGISVKRNVIDIVARWLGVYYPPAVLLLLLVGIIAMASLSFSVILSKQRRQLDRLIEENAILAAELREIREESRMARRAKVDPPYARSSPP